MPKIADLLGIVGSTFTIGSRSLSAGVRRLAFRSGSFLGSIDWNVTADRTITLPNATGTVLLNTTTVPLSEPRDATLRLGTGAGSNNTTGGGWIAIGTNAGAVNNSGEWTAIGAYAGQNSTSGQRWVAIGINAGADNINGGNWAAIGPYAGQRALGSFWTAIGPFAGRNNVSGEAWTAVGVGAGGQSTSGGQWTAIGTDAGGQSTSGGQWTAIGTSALQDTTTASNNTAVGFNTGRGITTGNGNTIVGANVGGLSPTLSNNVILASGNGAIKFQVDSTGLATLPISPIFSNNSTLVATTAHVKDVLINSPSITLTVLRWVSGSFLGSLNWITTAARTIVLPDDSGTIALSIPPVKITTAGANTATIPASAIGFSYVLCAAGGGGGNGGTTIGGGGAAAGEFVAGTIWISELMSTLAITRAQVILAVTIGASVSIGERGNNSTLAIGASTIAIAQGGYGGLAGTESQGWGPWQGGTTFTSAGGIGQRSQRNEARLTGEPNTATIVRLNLFGDGGNGGASNSAGLLGLPGYFSIQFF